MEYLDLTSLFAQGQAIGKGEKYANMFSAQRQSSVLELTENLGGMMNLQKYVLTQAFEVI